MKKIQKNRGGSFFSLLAILMIITVVVLVLRPQTVCEKPLEYSLGKVDNEFNISKNDFLKIISEAETIWEEGTGMNLFTYKENAPFKINLVFDERQRKTIAETKAREILNKGGDSYELITNKYETLLSAHSIKFKQYEEAVQKYDNRLTLYNEQVAYYNNIGGAPEKEYRNLEEERVQIKNNANQLKKEQAELSILNKKVNVLGSEVNKLASTYNNEVNQYNQAFGVSRTFDQGEYTGGEINVYQFDKPEDLRIVLTHEFGHAMNLDHVKGPASIMYYLMGEQDLKLPTLSQEDLVALNIECGIK